MSVSIDVVARVVADGPTRVVVDSGCYAVPPSKTDLVSDFVFVRDDGWCLGAPARYAREAFDLWRSDWTGVIDMNARTTMSVNDFAALLENPEFC